MSNSYKIGMQFEREFANKTGAKLTPGSGSKWYAKMDANHNRIVWSLKKTTQESYTVKRSLFDELRRVVNSSNADYDDIPALCVSVKDLGEIVMMELDDFISLLADDNKPSFSMDKATRKAAAAKVPELLREAGNG